MNEEQSIIDRLAALVGIEASYHDIWGEKRVLPRESKCALLAAMGFPAGTDAERRASLAALERSAWEGLLDPVVIRVAQGVSPLSIPLKFPASLSARRLVWTLREESGARQEGASPLEKLPLDERCAVEGQTFERRSLRLPASLAHGYHRLEIAMEGAGSVIEGVTQLIVAPPTCHLPEALRQAPGLWGFAVQIYGLAGSRSWGVGDFGELGRFADLARSLGANVIGVNPTNALFIGNPAHSSPYAPSSRAFLNPLYIDVEAVPEYSTSAAAQSAFAAPSFQRRLAAVRESPDVDYVGVAALKLPILEHLYATFRMVGDSERIAAFDRFCRAGGATLTAFATFEALSEWFRGGRIGHFSWRDWPAAYRDPASPEVAAFAAAHAERVGFYQYLQWEAERQLVAVAAKTEDMTVGLYRDLALGADPHGAEGWLQQRSLAFGATLGAPPDPFSPKGQNWGLPPFNPIALRARAYGPFIDLMRSNMRYAGALRIDHVLGFSRLFWIPDGAPASAGGYVRAPLDDLLAITALESQRARCVVIGEDLGTVPEGLRQRLAKSAILSCRLLYFEREQDGAFRRPQTYPDLAHVAVGSHDLPPLPGYWQGRDLELSGALELFPSREAEQQALAERALARRALVDALVLEGLWPEGEAVPEFASDALVTAVYAFLAQSRGRLLMVQLEDVLGQIEQANLPGTVSGHANWCRKLPVAADALSRDPRLVSLAALLRGLRPEEQANRP